MYSLRFVLILSFHVCRSLPVDADTVVLQIQQWRGAGSQQVEEQALLNGIPLMGKSPEFNAVIKAVLDDTLLTSLISFNQTSSISNHTILRSRECMWEGSKLRWADRVFADGQLYLTLNQNDMWTAHIQEAVAIKVVWDQEVQQTRAERLHLQEGCVKLMKHLNLSEKQSVPGILHLHLLVPVLALIVFGVLIMVSIVIYKIKGFRHPGGVIGSIVHYHRDMTEMTEKDREIV